MSVGLQIVLLQRDGKACTHQVAWPLGKSGSTDPPLHSKRDAHEFPFSIDPFQSVAIDALEAGDSVLVAAHTSAGKTVVAQYAIAMALRNKSRVRVCFGERNGNAHKVVTSACNTRVCDRLNAHVGRWPAVMNQIAKCSIPLIFLM